MRLLILFIIFGSTHSMAQVSYKDDIAKKQSNISRGHVADLRKTADDEGLVLDEMVVNVEAERRNNTRLRSIDVLGLKIKPIPIDLCENFINENSLKATECKAKSTYLAQSLLSTSKVALLANSMSAGEKQQVLGKYVAIINKIQYEIQQMETERDRRSLHPYIIELKKKVLE